MALAREEFGAVHAAGFDADEDAAGGGGWDGDGFDVEDLGSAGEVHDGRAHGFGHGGVEAVGGWGLLVFVVRASGSIEVAGGHLRV